MREPLRMPDGRLYTDARCSLYLGQGVKRSCAKCGVHKPVNDQQFAKRAPWGLCCRACREPSTQEAA